MNPNHPPLDDADLHAWVDDRLAGEEAARVRAALEADPALAALAHHYRAQNDALRAALDVDPEESVPAPLVAAAQGAGGETIGASSDRSTDETCGPAIGRTASSLRPAANRRWFAQAAALVAAIATGIAVGWFARGSVPESTIAGTPLQTLPLVRAAAIAHAAYVPEVRHPVEVAATEQTHLVAWLSKRLGTALKVPDLGADGFKLVGGRLLPDARDGVAAQFMFESGSGQRLTLYLRRDDERSDTAFRFAERDHVGTFYWLDRGFGYALTGELPRETMLSIATSVYRQLNP